MTNCKSCTHSIGCATDKGMILFCRKHDKDTEAVSQCDGYVYEPGTDAEESNG